ncbi:hypothetical protein GTU73_00630 [Rathayibacter sp. VKM Ac-2804]|uniref:hypothetical protein n=1 Tax=Rathayibacter sp. VKM Ac-2804 TaxID=2609257 RepID=UPI00132E8355|nr:hypothetical protein [Rathayibacter sp. VKM Ac-2804]QHF22661.1 hypothetical protein GTU73_00630 [Rathayibacter sp. VKM Ac-2804]
MLDLLSVIGVLAVFALIGVVARGVEALAPRSAGPRAAAEDGTGPRSARDGAGRR